MQILEITPQTLSCYQNLSQHYEAEFSPLTQKTPSAEGLYQITPLDSTHVGFLVFSDNKTPLGFAVVGLGGERFDVAEFYIIPTHRKSGLGKTLAYWIFDRFPGPWQVRQIRGADRAHDFWMAVIRQYTQGQMTHNVEHDKDWGEVRIQRFESFGSSNT